MTTKLAGLSIGLSTWRSIKSGIIEPCRRTPGSGAGAWRIRLLSITEVVCDPAPSVGGHERCSSPGLSTPASRRTTPLQRLIERDFKDASEAEKRKIVRENVAQLYGFDFD